jgi:hypothetical protein
MGSGPKSMGHCSFSESKGATSFSDVVLTILELSKELEGELEFKFRGF